MLWRNVFVLVLINFITLIAFLVVLFSGFYHFSFLSKCFFAATNTKDGFNAILTGLNNLKSSNPDG